MSETLTSDEQRTMNQQAYEWAAGMTVLGWPWKKAGIIPEFPMGTNKLREVMFFLGYTLTEQVLEKFLESLPEDQRPVVMGGDCVWLASHAVRLLVFFNAEADIRV